MNPLDRTLIEKAGYDNGWERVLEGSSQEVRLGSARHPVTARVESGPSQGSWVVGFEGSLNQNELERGLPPALFKNGKITPWDHQMLAVVLHRAAELAIALPDNPHREYARKVEEILKDQPDIRGTERERVVRQRIGQDVYRESLMRYWGGCCAVSGIDVPEILRASHAKPWADCDTDEDRLNVYNGFLLSANLDALFDKGLISFDNDGLVIVSVTLSEVHRNALGLSKDARLRWLDQAHIPFIEWHRKKVFKG